MISGMFGSITGFKKYFKYVLAVLVLGSVFFVGRCTAPTKTVTQTITLTEKAKIDTVQNQEVKTQIQYVDRPVDHIVTRTVIKEPSGKVTETTTDATHQGNTVVNSNQDAKTQVKTEIKTEIVYKDKLVEKLVVKDDFKRWEVGVDVGYQLTSDGENLIPGVPPKMVLGLNIDYNLTKSLSVGVWGHSSSEAGVKLGVKF